ncbi:hypothetical protein VTL71DRAFT_12283 [Oculimacula yallundae]|uniref:Clr5 domain-containing protein n=1 Tax=Oculimacula yallundae TaxID=86028 RepID=A0ABR4CNZ7_9HELO
MAEGDSPFAARGMKPKDWEDIKSEVYRLYIEEDQTMVLVRAELQATHGFRACLWKWKRMVKRWNYTKNRTASTSHAISAPIAQNAWKRKRTPSSEKRLDNTEKRIRVGVAHSLGSDLPENVRSYPPIPGYEGGSSDKETSRKPSVFRSTSINIPGSSLGHAWSVFSRQWETEPCRSYNVDLPDEAQISLIGEIDGWLSDEHQPWSCQHLSHQLNHHDDNSTEDHDPFDIVREFELPFEEYNARPEILNSTPQPRYLCQNPGYTAPALDVRFVLAEVFTETGKYDKAEEYCRNLIATDSQEDVAVLLGTILDRTGRLELLATWLFTALANFILDWTKFSFEQNHRLYCQIYGIFEILFRSLDHDWDSLSETLREIITILKDLYSV